MNEPRQIGAHGTSAEVEVAPDLMAILRRRWFLLGLCALLGIVAAQVFVSVRAPSYEARSTLLLIAAENEASPSGGRARTVDIDTWATVARSTELLRQVADDLGLELSVIQARTSAIAAATGDILILASQAPTTDQAIDGASVYSDRFLENRQAAINSVSRERRQQLEGLQDSLLSELDELGRQIANEEAVGTPNGDALPGLENVQQVALGRLGSVSAELDQLGAEIETGRVVVQPDTAVSPVGLGSPIILLSGLLAGALIGFILALLRDRYDDRYRSVTAASHFGIEEIVRLPRLDEDVDAGESAKVYGRLLVRLAYGQQREPELGRTVLILQVESDTIADAAAEVLAAKLRTASRDSGISTSIVRNSRSAATRAGERQPGPAPSAAMERALASKDLVLVPRPALDVLPAGIALAATADVTLLLVSDDTMASSIEQVIDDLDSVGTSEIKIAVVTGSSHFPVLSATWWTSRFPRTNRHDDTDAS